jgi:hypothetical protein
MFDSCGVEEGGKQNIVYHSLNFKGKKAKND